MSLNVLRDAQPSDDGIQRTLTIRFVYDWRWKPTGKAEGGQDPQFKWLRRARLVAREYAFAEGKRDDVFSPASSSHLLRLLPALYLCKTALDDFPGDDPYVLGSLDIKDAFLQVDQCGTTAIENAIRRPHSDEELTWPESWCQGLVWSHQQIPLLQGRGHSMLLKPLFDAQRKHSSFGARWWCDAAWKTQLCWKCLPAPAEVPVWPQLLFDQGRGRWVYVFEEDIQADLTRPDHFPW